MKVTRIFIEIAMRINKKKTTKHLRVFRLRWWRCGNPQFARTAVLVVFRSATEAGSGAIKPRARKSRIPLAKLIDVTRTEIRVQH